MNDEQDNHSMASYGSSDKVARKKERTGKTIWDVIAESSERRARLWAMPKRALTADDFTNDADFNIDGKLVVFDPEQPPGFAYIFTEDGSVIATIENHRLCLIS